MSDDDRRVGPCGKHCAVVDECEARGEVIRALRAENARLLAALKPFKEAAEDLDDSDKGNIYERHVAMDITCDDLRNCQRIYDSSCVARGDVNE